MARLVRNFIGGIASKVTGTYEEIDEEDSLAGEQGADEEEVPVPGVHKEEVPGDKDKSDDSIEEESGIVMKVSPSEEQEKVSFTSEEDEEGEVNGSVNGQEDDFLNVPGKPSSKLGHLSKWTNYLLGWQERYVVVKDGILSYYKSEFDLQFGCRGSISLHKVRLLVRQGTHDAIN